MLVTYTHSRAAVLCLGGWGLQVMLHLAPRLRAGQEQRAALQAQGPDLNRITSFSAVLPEPLLTGDGLAQFYLRRPKPDVTWPPFYVERLLGEIAAKAASGPDDKLATLLTASERRAAALLAAAEPMLEPLGYADHSLTALAGAPSGLPAGLGPRAASLSPRPEGARRRATRGDMFTTALTHADMAARLLETHLLDPIRQDALAPDDPFVQTTLYVVAPLFEPLSSALIWPLVGSLMARLGRRHISNVVGLFATGSYATDLTRGIEDAAAHSALVELEVLTGVRRDEGRRTGLLAAVRSTPSSLVDYVGERIFDRVYLLDREKANQGLAQDSQELAVLAGNALEALVVGSGDLFIQEQLGYGVHAEDRPYSLIGAAADYVPVNQILHAVNRQEESRLVRDWVLRNTPDEATGLARVLDRQPGPTLAELGFSQEQGLRQLAARLPELYANPAPQELGDLAVRQGFVYPTVTAHELARLSPQAWAAAFDEYVSKVRATFDLAVGQKATAEAWGLATVADNAGLGFAAGLEADDRLYPQVLGKMHKRLVDLLAASPTGLIRAHDQTQRWLHEAEEGLQKLQTFSTPSTRQLGRIQHELAAREWSVKYDELAAKQPSLAVISLRAVGATVLVGLLSLLYVVMAGRTWSLVNDGWALAGFGVGALAAGVATYRIHLARQTHARRARVALAQTEFTRDLQQAAHEGLLTAYTQLVSVLKTWRGMLREAMDELQALSTPPEMPATLPADLPQDYLYTPHWNQPLWDRCLSYLRRHLEEAGQRSEERLDKLWGTAKWRTQMQRVLRAAPMTLLGGKSQGRSIAEFIRQTVRESVAPVTLQEANPIRDNLIRGLASEFSIEHLLWRGAADAEDMERRLRAMALGLPESKPVATRAETVTHRRYVEAAWNRAKPTGNYDVADRLAVYGVTVDFAAASGKADSDLTRALLDEFSVTLLPTENPFVILFVRTVHGLTLDDLDCVRRYALEQRGLTPDERVLIQLAPSLDRDMRLGQNGQNGRH